MITTGETYIFTKSGNEVRAIAPTAPYHGQACWVVARTKGQSAGKEMTVLAASLVKEPQNCTTLDGVPLTLDDQGAVVTLQ